MHTRDLLTGAGIGAAVTFLLDPNGGAARRARVRDKMARASRKTREGLDRTTRDMANRTRGVVSATRARFASDVVDDQRLVERARAALGRWCSHPRALEVEAKDGIVTLRGPILVTEAAALLSAVETVRGVRGVVDELVRHQPDENVPALQGGGSIAGPSLDILQRRWAPATRALVACTLITTGLLVAVAYAGRRAA
jgi:gas vesicle protein